MGALGNDEKFYFNEFSKYQIKTSLGWMKLIGVIGFFTTAALYFFTFEFIRHEITRGRIREEEMIVLTIFLIACGLFTAIFVFLWSTIRNYSDFLKDGNPLTLQTALTKKKTFLILTGVLAILVAIGVAWLLSAYVYYELLRRW